MRDVLAALLRERGYTHDDAADPDDMCWYGPSLGVRPMLVCVAHEMNTGIERTEGWNRYEVATASRSIDVNTAPYIPRRNIKTHLLGAMA